MLRGIARSCAPILPLLALFACDDDFSRRASEDQFQGSVRPSTSEVVLQKLNGPQQPPIELVVIGGVELDPDLEQVRFDVALRNSGSESLVAPVAIRLGEFRPAEVIPFNADWLGEIGKYPGDGSYPYAFVYDEELGPDGILEPGELSAVREWIFYDPGLLAFSFGARAELAGAVGDPAISGMVFVDENFNGRYDDFEMPYGTGAVHATAADGTVLIAPVMPDGHYRFALNRTGLFELYYDDFTDGPWCTSTPNPLLVVVPPDENGDPTSYEGADFGYAPRCGPDPGGVVYTDRPLGAFESDPYHLVDAWARESQLVVRVQFSACQGGHPFTLVVSNHIMESNPPQVMAVLQHENMGDVCRMLQEEEHAYDLSDLLLRAGAPIYVRLLDFQGVEHRVLVGRSKDDG